MTEVTLFLTLDQMSSKDINQNAEKNERGQSWVLERGAHGKTGIKSKTRQRLTAANRIKCKRSRDEDTRALSELDKEEKNNPKQKSTNIK